MTEALQSVWRPISTAPKDGLIDIWLAEGKRWCDCYYDPICDEWRTSRPSGRLVWVKAQHVTHWMPRPATPRGAALAAVQADARREGGSPITDETPAQHEERTCTCGAGHGSLEGHTDWCDFTAYESLKDLAEVQADARREGGE